MRIGLLADIHEHVESLTRAIDRLRELGAERVLTLGDSLDTFGKGGRARETVDVLTAAGVEGVWGNHDFGLCHDVPDSVRADCDPAILAFTESLVAHLTIGECLFCHVEPHLDPYDPAALWCFDGLPDTPNRVQRCFDAVPQRFVFMGHLHRWLAMTPDARLDWDGHRPLEIGGHARVLVVIAPVFDGACALLDTTERILHPVRV